MKDNSVPPESRRRCRVAGAGVGRMSGLLFSIVRDAAAPSLPAEREAHQPRDWSEREIPETHIAGRVSCSGWFGGYGSLIHLYLLPLGSYSQVLNQCSPR